MTFVNKHTNVLKTLLSANLDNFIESLSSIEYTLQTSQVQSNISLAPVVANFQIPNLLLKTKNTFKTEKVFSDKNSNIVSNINLQKVMSFIDNIEFEACLDKKNIIYDEELLKSLLKFHNGISDS